MKIGIDVGGSHIGLGIVDENGVILQKKEKDYKLHIDDMSQIVLDTIIELIEELFKENNIIMQDIQTIGIAVPGTVTDKVIVKAENLGIENFKIVEELNKKFNIPIYLENDAKCAAIAEKQYGSLKQYDDALFLIIGTGVGGATFLNGELLRPKRYSGFEVGHMVINNDGPNCNCGRNGCFEVYSSIKRLKQKIQKEFDLPDIDGKRIKQFMIANSGNENLSNLIDEYINYLALGIANLINIFEPEAISIGGSFAYYKEILLEKLERNLLNGKGLYNKGKLPKLLVAELKNDAGIIGASMQF
jgi:glucokinase